MTKDPANHARAIEESVLWKRLLLVLLLAGSLLLLSCALAEGEQKAFSGIGDVRSGDLLIRTKEPGRYLPASKLKTVVNADISGIVARVTVRQSFKNNGGDWVEAVYVFPLPEDSAVDQLKMIIGDRVIVGQVMKAEEARATYQAAKKEGRQTSLVEQERPNMFTTAVANIAPGQTITIEIGYSQTLRYDGGRYSWRFPLTITPRYVPGKPKPGKPQGAGWAPDTDRVPDGSKITPYYADAKNPVEMHIRLNAGVPLAKLDSPYYQVETKESGLEYTVDLPETNGNRDFELTWRPQLGDQPEVTGFVESSGGENYALVMLLPPNAKKTQAERPREAIFIIDTSGSMKGTSIEQARRALLMALDRLKPRDRFNIIEFNSVPHALFSDSVEAEPALIGVAKNFVRGLRADGGTQMVPALKLALKNDPPAGYLRQVIFITDGSVGNESELFRLIHQRLKSGNLFTVGIGSAPNSYFMRKAAEFGRGSYLYIGKVSEVGEKMQRLFSLIENPVLTDVALSLPPGSEAYPKTVPNLYAGQPVVVSVKLPSREGVVGIRGFFGDKPWTRTFKPAEAPPGKVAQLWARAKIEALKDDMIRHGYSAETVAQIIAVALKHHLITDYTSLVAVDQTRMRPAADGLHTENLPLATPEGQVVDKAVKTAAPLPLVRVNAVSAYDETGYPLSGNGASLKLLLGAASLLLGLLLLALRRVRA